MFSKLAKYIRRSLLWPTIVKHLEYRQFAQAKTVLLNFVKTDPGDLPKHHLLLAKISFELEEHDDAVHFIDKFREDVHIWPGFSPDDVNYLQIYADRLLASLEEIHTHSNFEYLGKQATLDLKKVHFEFTVLFPMPDLF